MPDPQKKSSPLPGMLGRLHAGWLMLRDPETPTLGKLGIVILGLGGLLLMIAYGISPIDLIPDVLFPVGFIDDLILIPLMLWVLSRFMPRDKAQRILERFGKRKKTSAEPDDQPSDV